MDHFHCHAMKNNKSKTIAFWVNEVLTKDNRTLKEKTSTSSRSVLYPKLQIFVEIRFCTNLEPAQYGASMSLSFVARN